MPQFRMHWPSIVPAPLVAAVMAATLGAGCAMVPPEEDPTFIKLSELDSRLTRVERVVDSEGLVNILKQIEQLQSDSQALRGQVETLQFQLEQASSAQKQQYQDADRRLQAIEKSVSERSGAQGEGTSVLDGKELKAGQLPVPGGSDRANYQAAFELLKQGRHKEANAALRQFMVAFPESSLLDNAQYWLAETDYVRQRYEKALAEFTVVVDKYPQSRKIPDALLKIGYCNYELKRYSAARKSLQAVVASYPETTAARLAGQRLESMRGEGI
ncbi:MAG: tol-pal system protein YbgF [Gammaproteobacteria bacterium]